MPRRAVRRPTRSRSTSPRRRPTRGAVNAAARSRSGPSPRRRGAVALSLPCILYPRLLASHHTHAERRPAAGDARVVVVVLILTLPFPLPPVVQRRGVHIINASPYLPCRLPHPFLISSPASSVPCGSLGPVFVQNLCLLFCHPVFGICSTS